MFLQGSAPRSYTSAAIGFARSSSTAMSGVFISVGVDYQIRGSIVNRKSKFLGRRRMAVALCLFFSAGLAAARTIVQSFDGDSGPGLAACQSGLTHCDRPEMNVGTNGKQVVQVTWQNVRVYDTSGRLLESTPMATFVRKAGINPVSSNPRIPNPPTTPGPYEPSIVYDEFIG